MYDTQAIALGELHLDLFCHTISTPDTKTMLTPIELEIMRYMMLHPERWLSYTDILWAVWDTAAKHMDSSVVRIHVGHIRRKIGKEWIHSKRHHGYMLVGKRGKQPWKENDEVVS